MIVSSHWLQTGGNRLHIVIVSRTLPVIQLNEKLNYTAKFVTEIFSENKNREKYS